MSEKLGLGRRLKDHFKRIGIASHYRVGQGKRPHDTAVLAGLTVGFKDVGCPDFPADFGALE